MAKTLPNEAPISKETVAHVAQLANIPISTQEQVDFAQAFTQTLEEVNNIMQVDVEGVQPTHHSTGTVNVWRRDEVDEDRLLSQEAAVSQAPHTLDGFVVVDRVLEESA